MKVEMLLSATRTGPDLADALLDVMSTVRRAARRQAGALAEVASLTTAQLQLVRAVHRRAGISVAEAADELGVAPNTVSTLVHQLADAGVLERRSGPPDRRVARLFLRPAVAQGLGEWAGRRSDAMAVAVARLSEADRRALADALGPLARLGAAIGRKGPRG